MSLEPIRDISGDLSHSIYSILGIGSPCLGYLYGQSTDNQCPCKSILLENGIVFLFDLERPTQG